MRSIDRIAAFCDANYYDLLARSRVRLRVCFGIIIVWEISTQTVFWPPYVIWLLFGGPKNGLGANFPYYFYFVGISARASSARVCACACFFF